MNPKKLGGNIPKVDQLIRDVAGLSIDTPQDDTRINEELCETVCDREIVWPPMILVRYHEKYNNEKVYMNGIEEWIRCRDLPYHNAEMAAVMAAVMARHSSGPRGLLSYFSEYKNVMARHCLGQRGMSLLIFENSALGYVEAERLHKHFADQGADKDAWDHCRTRHEFYGYTANKEDIDIFNQHSEGKMKVKFEMRSHHEMVVIPMDGDNTGREPHRETLEENRIVRQRTKMQHEQNKEEMDCQEQFFKDQINYIHQASEKERAFEELLPEERKKMQQSIVDSSGNEDLRQKEISKL